MSRWCWPGLVTRDREQDQGGEVRGSVTALAADWGLLTNCLEKQVVASVAGRRQLQLCSPRTCTTTGLGVHCRRCLAVHHCQGETWRLTTRGGRITLKVTFPSKKRDPVIALAAQCNHNIIINKITYQWTMYNKKVFKKPID